MNDSTTPINNEVTESRIAPAYQELVFLVMWKSNRSGGTYTMVRRSKESLERFLNTLDYLGVNLSEVKVFEQSKPWIPVRKTKKKEIQRDDK